MIGDSKFCQHLLDKTYLCPYKFWKICLGLSSSQVNYWGIDLLRCSPRIIITDVLLDGPAVFCLCRIPGGSDIDTPMFEVTVVVPYHTALYHIPWKLFKWHIVSFLHYWLLICIPFCCWNSQISKTSGRFAISGIFLWRKLSHLDQNFAWPGMLHSEIIWLGGQSDHCWLFVYLVIFFVEIYNGCNKDSWSKKL